jgi:flagellar secretion chaperone FliS
VIQALALAQENARVLKKLTRSPDRATEGANLSGYTRYHEAYVEGSVLSGNPIHLVVLLYEGAIAAARDAKYHFDAGNRNAGSAAISKCSRIITQLSLSLDHQNGGEISQNLKRLYAYIQRQLSEAHASHKSERLTEVEQLLSTLLEAWSVLAAYEASACAPEAGRSNASKADAVSWYGDYFGGAEESELAVTF